jgi:Lrp/AsnC family leucine-responsive transcriptional regulator
LTQKELKKKDKCILKALLDNGRLSYSELGRRCGISRQVAFERVRKLSEGGVVKGFSVCLDADKFGFSFKAYVLLIAKPDEKLRNELAAFLRHSKNVNRSQLLFGRFDFFLELLFRDKDELTEFLRAMQSFGAVERTETFIVYQTLKDKPGDVFIACLDEESEDCGVSGIMDNEDTDLI